MEQTLGRRRPRPGRRGGAALDRHRPLSAGAARRGGHRSHRRPAGGGVRHIHEGGACTGDGFADTGGHYNPAGADHPCHAGDLPPLFATGGGRAELRVLTDRFSVREIIGRTVVIHSGPDDFTTQPAGNAGSKIACGVIQPA